MQDDLHIPAQGRIIGREIILYKETSSTNDDVLQIGAQKDSQEGLVVIADRQTGGKGRHGRRWISPPGVNLYFTVLLRPSLSPEEATVLPFMASVAVVEGIRECTGLNASIKWPNDIMIGNKKTGGILMEMRTSKGIVETIALGIGINVNMSSDMFEHEIKDIATSLMEESGKRINRSRLLKTILERLDNWYNMPLKELRDLVIERWRHLDSTTGNRVVVTFIGSKKRLKGMATGIDKMGRLTLRLDSGRVEKVSAGDVTILRD